jgi:hypothetical protein
MLVALFIEKEGEKNEAWPFSQKARKSKWHLPKIQRDAIFR